MIEVLFGRSPLKSSFEGVRTDVDGDMRGRNMIDMLDDS